MCITAENVAAKYAVSMQYQDALALSSHNRAEAAITAGYFKEQIVPIVRKTRKGDVVFDTDEHVRFGATAQNFSSLKPVFMKENGTVTAGNASGLNDGAAAVLMLPATEAKARGWAPLARLVAYGHASRAPTHLGS